MHTPYLEKVAKEKGIPIKEAEAEGHAEDYDYITTIFKEMIKNKGKKK